MLQTTIEALLGNKIGLDASTIGSSKIAKAVEMRRVACSLPDLPSYLQRLQTSPQELEELIENVIVPETWFFRDRKPFDFLGRYVISEWLPSHSNSILRLLSLPCCTGEEPYSIAIALIEAGLNPVKFSIDAIDISHQTLNKAQKAIYGKNSFRGQELSEKQHYFQQLEEGYQVSDLVRKRVNFRHGNLLELFLDDNTQYDIIFCRNLLIYFDDSARSRAISILERLLRPNGLLFVGSAETGIIATQNLVSVRQPFTFAYRKVEDMGKQENRSSLNSPLVSNAATTPGNTKTKPEATKTNPKRKNSTPSPTAPSPSEHSPSKESKSEPSRKPMTNFPTKTTSITSKGRGETSKSLSNLQTARDLADRGNLEEAATLCKTYLEQNYTSIEAYLLLGEVYQGVGKEEEAEQCFRKVIYLDPNHYDALMHLALLKEHQGDMGSATLLRQRIQRLQQIYRK